MQAKFNVGDIVYVQGKVLTVEEQPDDVRYSITTSIAKYFCSEVNDSIRRSADSERMIERTFNEGQEAYFEFMDRIRIMTEKQLKECFGEEITTFTDIFDIEDVTYDTLIDMYDEWFNNLNIKVNDVVEYIPEDSDDPEEDTKICVVTKVQLLVIDDNGTTALVDYDAIEDEIDNDPDVDPNKVFTLYEPTTNQFYAVNGSDELINTGSTFNIIEYFNAILTDFLDLGLVSSPLEDMLPEEGEVISEDDPDFEEDDAEDLDTSPEDEDEEGEEEEEEPEEPEEPEDNNDEGE